MDAETLQRLKDETTELWERRAKLTLFIQHSDEYKQLADEDKRLLNQQLRIMGMYANILADRVARATAEETNKVEE